MSVALALLFFGRGSLAANSSSSEGWQTGDDNRSSWDLLWGCVSTILACTWTALHANVPRRHTSNFRISCRKVSLWFLTIMGPELTAWIAAQELWQARSTALCCNKKQAAKNEETHEPEAWLQQRSVPLSQALHGESQPSPAPLRWTLAQCFCRVIRGVVIQTEDEWIYTIHPKDIDAFIDADLISCTDFRKRDVDDRAKADSFAKAFTVLQSTWTVINILARAVYSLPISLLELATVSYVACGIIIYAFWWHKPKTWPPPSPSLYLTPEPICHLRSGLSSRPMQAIGFTFER